MELNEEHRRHIEAIKSTMRCPLDFRCERLGFGSYPSVKPLGELLECLEEEAEYCPFSSTFGIGYLCNCPLNRYIYSLGKGKAAN
jgi:hypothetical protein